MPLGQAQCQFPGPQLPAYLPYSEQELELLLSWLMAMLMDTAMMETAMAQKLKTRELVHSLMDRLQDRD